MKRGQWWLLLLLLLAACSNTAIAPTPTEQEPGLRGAGGTTPQDAVESFVIDVNQALSDPALGLAVRQRYWSDRLASYFAPTERADQRLVMVDMLDSFASSAEQLVETIAAGAAQPVSAYKITLEIGYNSMDVQRQQGDRAAVRLVDGVLRLRVVLRTANQGEQVVRNDQRPFGETIGLPDGVLPLLRVGGRWFLTEDKR